MDDADPQERIDQMGEKIEQARENAREVLSDEEDERTYKESGDMSEGDAPEERQDDQTIAPPG